MKRRDDDATTAAKKNSNHFHTIFPSFYFSSTEQQPAPLPHPPLSVRPLHQVQEMCATLLH